MKKRDKGENTIKPKDDMRCTYTLSDKMDDEKKDEDEAGIKDRLEKNDVKLFKLNVHSTEYCPQDLIIRQVF